MKILKVLGITSKVACNVGKTIVGGTLSTLNVSAKVLTEAANGNARGVSRALGNFVGGVAVSSVEKVKAATDIIDRAERPDSITNEQLVKAATAGTLLVVGANALDFGDEQTDVPEDVAEIDSDDSLFDPTDPGCAVHGPACDGIFVGSEEDLQALIEEGEVENSDHIDAEDIQRSEAVKNDFLETHGLKETPEGYEIHHKVPLSQGGSDSTDNMILVSEEDHDKITSAHREFYKWNK